MHGSEVAQQAQTQTIEEQLHRLHTYCQNQQWSEQDLMSFLDNGYSGASLKRPGLDRLRDALARAEIERILLTEPSRLARNYVHQSLLLEEFQSMGRQVIVLDHPMSQDPHDQLLLHIRGAVAEYERTLIGSSHASWSPTEAAGRYDVTLWPSSLRLSQ
jgi:site-specific DNA recombinase